MHTATHPQSAPLTPVPPIDLGRLHPVTDDDPVFGFRAVPTTIPMPAPVQDRLERDLAATRAREAFCAELTAQRLRVGLTLDALSAATKINASLFAQLERGDLSHWPRGIYRRAFFREYASAIGLDIEEAMTAFQDNFPDYGPSHVLGLPSDFGPNALRLTLAPDPRVGPLMQGPRMVAAAIDAVGVAGVAVGLTTWLQIDLYLALSGTALGYSLLTTAVFGRSLASWWMRRGVKWQRDRDIRNALRALKPAASSDR